MCNIKFRSTDHWLTLLLHTHYEKLMFYGRHFFLHKPLTNFSCVVPGMWYFGCDSMPNIEQSSSHGSSPIKKGLFPVKQDITLRKAKYWLVISIIQHNRKFKLSAGQGLVSRTRGPRGLDALLDLLPDETKDNAHQLGQCNSGDLIFKVP